MLLIRNGRLYMQDALGAYAGVLVYARWCLYMLLICNGALVYAGVLVYARNAYAGCACICKEMVVYAASIQGTLVYPRGACTFRWRSCKGSLNMQGGGICS